MHPHDDVWRTVEPESVQLRARLKTSAGRRAAAKTRSSKETCATSTARTSVSEKAAVTAAPSCGSQQKSRRVARSSAHSPGASISERALSARNWPPALMPNPIGAGSTETRLAATSTPLTRTVASAHSYTHRPYIQRSGSCAQRARRGLSKTKTPERQKDASCDASTTPTFAPVRAYPSFGQRACGRRRPSQKSETGDVHSRSGVPQPPFVKPGRSPAPPRVATRTWRRASPPKSARAFPSSTARHAVSVTPPETTALPRCAARQTTGCRAVPPSAAVSSSVFACA